MIALLKGRIEEVGDGFCVVDVNGVGYLVFCSSRTLGRVAVGEAATVHIETHVREDHIHLYGFLDRGEREWFKLLTTVQGVGAKVALAILSVLSGDELTHAIAAGDKAQVGRANGVGPKLAGRIVTELKDKVAAIALGAAAGPKGVKMVATGPGAGASDATRDATSALVNLGYSPSDALAAVSHAAGKLGEGADVAALIRGGLAELGPKEHGR
ncbi:MAG: Holliday junction branch migration protein RuvA [Alphaproteobacteria bacterium]|nr:Holliday junction branch migration protein RuvA [Alphaproteobacteria bacterium]